jgi:hypothetical protein
MATIEVLGELGDTHQDCPNGSLLLQLLHAVDLHNTVTEGFVSLVFEEGHQVAP